MRVKNPTEPVTYIDAESKLSMQELAKHEPRTMECFDCRAVGHPFRNPADALDEAIAEARSTAACRRAKRAD